MDCSRYLFTQASRSLLKIFSLDVSKLKTERHPFQLVPLFQGETQQFAIPFFFLPHLFDNLDGIVYIMNHHDGREPLDLRLATALQYSAYDKGERYADGSTQDGHKKTAPVKSSFGFLFHNGYKDTLFPRSLLVIIII